MISNHLNLVEQQRQRAEALSDQVAQFIAAGGQIAQLKSPPHNPLRLPAQTESTLKRCSSESPKGCHWLSAGRFAKWRTRYE